MASLSNGLSAIRDALALQWDASRLSGYIEPFPLALCLEGNGGGSTTSGAVRITYFVCPETCVVDAVRPAVATVQSGASVTTEKFGLFTVGTDGGLASQLAVTANDTSWFAAASTVKTFSGDTQAALTQGVVYAGAFIYVGSGGTSPALNGARSVAGTALGTGDTRLNGSVSGQTDIPSSVAIGSIGNTGNRHWFGLRKV